MNKRTLVIATLAGVVSLGHVFGGGSTPTGEGVELQYSITASGMDDGQGSIVLVAFEEFNDTPTVNEPEDLTVQFSFPTNGGSGPAATAVLTCKSVESIELVGDYHIFQCHLDGDIHTGDGETYQNGKAIRVFAPQGWASGGGDVSEEVNSTDGNENYLVNSSEVANDKPTHHWDSRPFQIQESQFFVDSIATHRYGIFKVEHRIAGASGWTNATLTHKEGPTPDDPWIPVWRSTLDADAIADTLDGEIEVRVTPARGDAGSILTSGDFDPSLGHHSWSHADFRHPHETNLPVLLNHDGNFDDELTIVYAAVSNSSSGDGEVSLTETGARTNAFLTIEDAKLAIEEYRNQENHGTNDVNAGVIVLEEGTFFLGSTPESHWVEGVSDYVANKALCTIRAASTNADPEDVIITNCAFVVRIPAGKSPDNTGFIRIVDPGEESGNPVKLEVRPNSGVPIDDYPFSGPGELSTVGTLVTALNNDGYEAVALLPDMPTYTLKFRTWLLAGQAGEETHFRFFEINHDKKGVNVQRLMLKDLTTHTTQILSATGSSKRTLILDSTRHRAHAQGEHASEIVARSGSFHHGVWVYSAYFENLVTAGNGWTYARDCHFVRCADAFKKCIAAVNPRYEESGVILGQDTHADMFQWFVSQTTAPPPPEDDPEDVAAVAETSVYNLLHLNGNASDPANDAQPFFFTAGDSGTYKRISIINYQWNEINRETAFYGNYDGLNLWHLSGLQGGVKKIRLHGFAEAISRYENLSIRNAACEELHITARAENATGTQGDTPSFWSVLNELHIRSALEDAEGTLTITLYPDATTGASVDDLFTTPSAGDLSPDEARTGQPHLFDRPSEVPLLWPYDAKGTERISDDTGAIGALERKRLVDWSSYTIIIGTHEGGGLAQVESSDNTYLSFHSAGSPGDAEIEFTGSTDVNSPRTMIVRIESRLETAGTATVKLKVPGTSTFDTVESYSVGTTDALETFEVDNFEGYIANDGTVVMRILYEESAASLGGFDAFIDLAEVEIQ